VVMRVSTSRTSSSTGPCATEVRSAWKALVTYRRFQSRLTRQDACPPAEAETWFTDRVERCALALRKLRGFTLDLNLYITDDESPGIVCLTDSASSTAAGSEKGKDGDVSEKSCVSRAAEAARRFQP
jgi:hypothetical protein